MRKLAQAATGLHKGLDLDPNATLSRLFTTQATVQLERLPFDHLKVLSENLSHWTSPKQSAALPPGRANSLSQLKRLADKEATRRAMLLGFRAIVVQRVAKPQAAGQRFNGILRLAESLRPQRQDKDTAPRTRQLCLAKEMLAQCVINGGFSLEDAHHLMDALPTPLLREWLAARQEPEFHDAGPIDDLIRAHIALQEKDLSPPAPKNPG